jgi:multiple sugar transport system substrate-binding protein
MPGMTRRTLINSSLGLAAAGTLARPFVANAQAKTATVWWVQGFVPQEDTAFRKLVADYEKQSGNKIDYTIVPFAPLRQKFISAITSGQVPDLVEPGYSPYVPVQAWDDKLVDVSDVIEPNKSLYSEAALLSSNCYNKATKRRSYYGIPWALGVTPFHIWGSLVEKAGYKVADIPDKWDAFIDFFLPMQKKLQAQGMRHTYATGFVVSTNGGDPVNTFNHFLVAYGGEGIVTKDGRLHSKDPKITAAVTKAFSRLSSLYLDGYIPPSSINWDSADDNNAFHSKLCVMDFDGTLSTELAMLRTKEGTDAFYHEVITRGLPLSNEGKPVPSFLAPSFAVIPKGAKNVAVAKDFAKYFQQPEVNNEWQKGGLGRHLGPYPEIVKNDAWWLHSKDPHLLPYVKQGLFSPTLPPWYCYSPAWAQVESEHVFDAAMGNVLGKRMTPSDATEQAFNRTEAIFAQYPIEQA